MSGRFVRPKTIEEAVDLLAKEPGVWTPLLGGTDLLVKIRMGLVRPMGLMDLSGIEGFDAIRIEDGTVFVGAGVTHAQLAQSEIIRLHAPALAQAASMIGSPQIRNRGTIGGNIVNASPAADTLPPLFVHGAEVVLQGPSGPRVIPIEHFATGPGSTVRAAEELLVEVRFSAKGPAYRSVFHRLGTRKALAIAKVSVAVGGEVGENGVLRGVRVALGAVGPTVLRAVETERLLEGVPALDCLEAACDCVKKEARPISDIRSTEEYRREMCGVLLRRAVMALIEK